MELWEKLKLLRKEKNLTQKEASEKIGISISSLRNYENPNISRIPSSIELNKLKKFYGVSLEYLTDDNCQNKQNKNELEDILSSLSDKTIENLQNIKQNNQIDCVNILFKNEFIRTLTENIDLINIIRNKLLKIIDTISNKTLKHILTSQTIITINELVEEVRNKKNLNQYIDYDVLANICTALDNLSDDLNKNSTENIELDFMELNSYIMNLYENLQRTLKLIKFDLNEGLIKFMSNI